MSVDPNSETEQLKPGTNNMRTNMDILESPNFSEDSNFQPASRRTHSMSEQQSHRVWKVNENDDESIAGRQDLVQLTSKKTSKCQSGQ